MRRAVSKDVDVVAHSTNMHTSLSQTERSMKQVCNGTKTKEEFIEEDLQMYKEMFEVSDQEINKLITVSDQTDLNVVY